MLERRPGNCGKQVGFHENPSILNVSVIIFKCFLCLMFFPFPPVALVYTSSVQQKRSGGGNTTTIHREGNLGMFTVNTFLALITKLQVMTRLKSFVLDTKTYIWMLLFS